MPRRQVSSPLGDLINRIHHLRPFLESGLLQMHEMKRLLQEKVRSLNKVSAKLKLERMRNEISDQNLTLADLKEKKIFMAEGRSAEYNHIVGRIAKIDESIKLVLSKVEYEEKRFQEKKERFNFQLKEVEYLQDEISLKVIEKFIKCEEEISKITVENRKDPQFFAKWTEVSEQAQDLINLIDPFAKTIQELDRSEQVDSQCKKLESKIINWEKNLEQILNDRMELIEILTLETDSKPSQEIKDLNGQICQLEKEKEIQELKNSCQEMEEDFEPELQQFNDDIEQEKDALLEENMAMILETDLAIPEFNCELTKEKTNQEQTEEMRIKLEEMQKSAQATIHEKNLQIEELQKDLDGFLRKVEKALNKPSELDQDENLEVKEEEIDLENRSLKSKIAEVQQKLEEAVSMAQGTEQKLIGKNSESLGDEDLISTLRAQIAKKDAELENIRANYVSREDHEEIIRKMQSMIDAEKSKYSRFFNTIHEKVSEEASKFAKEEVMPENQEKKSQSQKQLEELTLKDNIGPVEFSFNFEKEGQKDVSLKNFNRNGKRSLDDLFVNSEKNYGKKSASKLNNEKENIGVFSQEKNVKPKEPITVDTDDEDLGGVDEMKKKIKQE